LRKYNEKWFGILPKKAIEPDCYIILKFDIFLVPLLLLGWWRRQQHGKKSIWVGTALTRSLGRPKNRWEDDVKSDTTKTKITNWKDCIRNRHKRK